MAFLSNSLFLEILLALVMVLVGCYYYLTSNFNYWKNRNVPFLKPRLGTGNLNFKKPYTDSIKEMYNTFKNERYYGIYQFREPALMIRDPKLIERIFIKDFSHFEDRGLPLDETNDPLSVNLVNLCGNKWRSLRHKLTPTHTSGKLKKMFEQMYNCGENMLNVVVKHSGNGEEINTLILTSTFSTDVIASCAFGLQIAPDSPEGKRFTEMVNKALGNTRGASLRMMINMFFPKIAKFLRIKKTTQDVTTFFTEITKATIKHRLQNNIKREDFLQLLMNLKQQDDSGRYEETNRDEIDQEDIHLKYVENSKLEDDTLKITEELMAAQSFIFLAAGSETTSTVISVVLHHVATHPEVQRKLQEEVDSVLARHDGHWSYQSIKDMTYLDQIIQESQRLFPVGHVTLRKCTSSYKVPESDLVIESGTSVIIPTIALHHDPNYHADPMKFDPDRFAGNNFKPSSVFHPFGDGPRMCIAMRFAILEVKVFVARLVSKFSMTPGTKTISPLQYDPKTFTTRPLGGVWMSFRPRDI